MSEFEARIRELVERLPVDRQVRRLSAPVIQSATPPPSPSSGDFLNYALEGALAVCGITAEL